MKLKKTLAAIAAGALCVTMGAAVLAGCGGKGTDYTFEAETATLEGEGLQNGSTPGPATLKEGQAYMINGVLVEDGTTVGGYDNFNSIGQKITWTVVSSSACKATLTFHAASSLMYTDFNQETSEMKVGIREVDCASANYKLSCNGTQAGLKGKLPGKDWENGFNDIGAPGVWWNMGTATAKIKLKQGENTIVFEIVGYDEGQQSAGVNIDKIVINASSELSAKS